MNGIVNPIIYYPAAIIMILFAFLAIKFKNIFYSLLSAIIVFFFAGLLFYMLGAEFNAVIQIAVYGVAVPVLLALSIMFTDLRKDSTQTDSKLKYILLSFGIIFAYIIFTSLTLVHSNYWLSDIKNLVVSNIGTVADGIFVQYVFAFEIISLILTISVVGLSVLKYKRRVK